MGLYFHGGANPILLQIGRIKFWSWDCISVGVQTQFVSSEIQIRCGTVFFVGQFSSRSAVKIRIREIDRCLDQLPRNRLENQFFENSLKSLV
jgi:hypothetical protein